MIQPYALAVGTARFSATVRRCAGHVTVLALLLPWGARAQAPTVTAVSPAPNLRNAARTSPVQVSFSQPLTAGSAAALKVFSAQWGGLRTATTPAVASGSTLTYTPPAARPWLPGETVFSTVTTAAAGSSGSLAQARVAQFTAAAGGTGTGNFLPGTDVDVNRGVSDVAAADMNGDGALDVVYASVNGDYVVTVLNNGSGTFSSGSGQAVGSYPTALVTGDVDGDGDLDLLTANSVGNTVSLVLNNGNGGLSSGSAVAVGSNPYGLAVGDVDGDGDLDLLTANTGAGTVSVRLNNGSGTFGGGSEVALGNSPYKVVVGDVDGDGDLDLLVANLGAGTVSVRLNNGSGTFGGGSEVAVGSNPYSVVLGDVDGDGDLDLLTANSNSTGTVSVRLNNGSGTFGGGSEVAVGSGPVKVALGDVDADGDLDLLTANGNANTVSTRLNSGSGTFGGGATLTSPGGVIGVALGDVDGDGDLDLLVANQTETVLSVLLNQPPPPVISSFTPTTGAVGATVTLTGINLGGATSVSFNGTPQTTFTSVSPTQIVLTVPAGTTTGPLTVTTPSGTSPASAQTFTFLPAPVISSFTPTSGVAGTSVTLTGTNLGGASSVSFNGAAQTTFTSATATQIVLTVPAGAITGPLTVTAAGGPSAPSSQTFFLPPTISSFTPVSGGVGATVTITGTNLTGATSVSFNGTAQTSFLSGGNTQLMLTVPANATTGTLTVTTPGGTSPASSQVFTVAPIITSFTPTSGGVGTSVTLTGLNLTGATSVSFNGTYQNTFTSISATQLVFNVPAGATTGQLRVTAAGGISDYSSQTFTVILPPTISSFTPTTGTVGTTVTLTGTNLTGATGVSFNGTAQTTFTSATATRIVLAVPAGATTGRLTVTTPGGTSALSTQTFYLLPTISSFTPLNGPTGTSVTLTGTNLTGATSVKFNGTAQVSFTSISNTQIVLNVPASATTGRLTVTTPGGTSALSAQTFTVTPAITSFTPTSGGVGTVVTITGTTLTGATSVKFNGTAQTTFTSVTATRIVLAVPAGATTGPLTVTTPGGTSPASAQTFTLLPQTAITSFTPTSGEVGTVVTITGSNFTGATAVAFNGQPAASFTVNSATKITARVAAGTTTGTVSVTAPGGVGTSPGTFTVFQPLTVTGLDPARNARAAANQAVAVTFDQAPTAASAANIRLFSSQYRGLRAATTTVSGNTATRTLTGGYFRPGEAVSVTVPATVLSANGLPTYPQVYQFTTATSGTGRGNFVASPTAVGVGAAPGSVAVGDVNGDGKPDFVAANRNGNTVSVRLNNGTGGFAGSSNPFVGPNPSSVTLADVDGDGDLDLLTANYGDNTVTVALNNGTGNFASSYANYYVGSSPSSVQVGDVDADGDLDFVVVNSNDYSVSVYLNDGTGNFAGGSDFYVGVYFTSLAMGDVDADGDLDLVTANSNNNSVYVYLNDGAGNFGFSYESYVDAPTSLVLGDVDGDGTLDVLVTSSNNTVGLLLNAGGSLYLSNYFGVGSNPISVQVGDVDADGDLDFITANSTANTVSVGLNDGTGYFFAGAGISTVNSPAGVALGDLDADGDLDLLAPTTSNTVRVALNGGTGPRVALPVELTAFTATAEGPAGYDPAGYDPAAVRLAWATASEKNSARFEVERSANGREFARLGTVAAAGSSSAPRRYELLDSKLPRGAATLYYRLKQVDLDGTFSYSPVRTVAVAGAAAGLSLYPNPAHGGAATLTGALPGAVVTVYDALGRPVTSATADASGTAALALPVGLPTGVYVVRAGSQAVRLTVE